MYQPIRVIDQNSGQSFSITETPCISLTQVIKERGRLTSAPFGSVIILNEAGNTIANYSPDDVIDSIMVNEGCTVKFVTKIKNGDEEAKCRICILGSINANCKPGTTLAQVLKKLETNPSAESFRSQLTGIITVNGSSVENTDNFQFTRTYTQTDPHIYHIGAAKKVKNGK